MISVDATRRYFDKYVATWNPCDTHHMNITIHRALQEDPCLLDTSEIFNSNLLNDYDKLMNRVP